MLESKLFFFLVQRSRGVLTIGVIVDFAVFSLLVTKEGSYISAARHKVLRHFINVFASVRETNVNISIVTFWGRQLEMGTNLANISSQ